MAVSFNGSARTLVGGGNSGNDTGSANNAYSAIIRGGGASVQVNRLDLNNNFNESLQTRARTFNYRVASCQQQQKQANPDRLNKIKSTFKFIIAVHAS
jgi:hypothetical protein